MTPDDSTMGLAVEASNAIRTAATALNEAIRRGARLGVTTRIEIQQSVRIGEAPHDLAYVETTVRT
ncbi:hypothetical protein [Elioraea rosea]|uniref:hypothetical protein n=1 Tax=Elioraea rosea TaxID=2492390 RepID=UPI0011844487|nr:hypothetical protein [Elioraea rosea]